MALDRREREELIDRYARGPARFRDALARVPEEVRTWWPAPGQWSVHEVVCHCADSETNAASRIRFVVAEKGVVLPGYDRDAWPSIFDYHSHPLEAALAAIEAIRLNTTPLLRRLPEDAWEREVRHSEFGPYSAERWLRTYAVHLDGHAQQIEDNLHAWHAARR